jgi:sphingolipid 8-(E)-desaturase
MVDECGSENLCGTAIPTLEQHQEAAIRKRFSSTRATTNPRFPPNAIPAMGKPIWTREQVAARILAGETLFILGNKVIRVPQSWLDAHPGGSLAILHFVGRNATDEVDAFHSEDAMRRIKKYEVAEVEVGEHGWEPFVPPVMSGWVRRLGKDGKMEWYREASPVRPLSEEHSDTILPSQILLVRKEELKQQSGPTLEMLHPGPSTLSARAQAEHSKAYKELHQRITDAGLYKTRYITGYGPEVVRYVFFVAVSAIAYWNGWFLTSAFFLGLYWHQVTFTVHDLGHLGVTHDWVKDRIIAILIADLSGGLSVGWWVDVSTQSRALRPC